jgi:hypothetical protein
MIGHSIQLHSLHLEQDSVGWTGILVLKLAFSRLPALASWAAAEWQLPKALDLPAPLEASHRHPRSQR